MNLERGRFMKINVYSCVSPGYDNLMSDRDYVMPSDLFATDRMNAKLPKVLAHKYFGSADYTIWADSNLVFKIDPRSLVEFFDFPLVGVFAHNKRSTVDQEINACREKQLDSDFRLNYHAGKPGRLACCFLLIRRNCDSVNALNESWWSEICAGSSRDQLSFPYTLGKVATYRELPDNSYSENAMWARKPHLR